MHITLSISGHGAHPAAWQLSSLPTTRAGLPRYDAIVQSAEKARLDAVIVASPPEAGDCPGSLNDILQPDNLAIAASLAGISSRIGLGASFPVRYSEPFNLARTFSALDNLMAGRACWKVETRSEANPLFGHHRPAEADEHYRRAGEFLCVARKLWDSWEADAVLADKSDGMFADSKRIHPIDHAGEFFTVRGPLVAIRPPQGHPPLIMDDPTDHGVELAGRYADIVLVSGDGLDHAIAMSKTIRRAAVVAGRSAFDVRILATLCPILAESRTAAERRATDLDGRADPEAVASMGPRFIGTPDALAAHMAGWICAGAVDGFNLEPPVLSSDVAILLDEVAPRLRSEGLLREAYSGTTLREHLGLSYPTSQFAREVA